MTAKCAVCHNHPMTGPTDTITAAAPIDSLLAAFSRARARDDSAVMARVGSLLGSQLASEELEAAEARARREEGRADRLRDELTETERTRVWCEALAGTDADPDQVAAWVYWPPFSRTPGG